MSLFHPIHENKMNNELPFRSSNISESDIIVDNLSISQEKSSQTDYIPSELNNERVETPDNRSIMSKSASDISIEKLPEKSRGIINRVKKSYERSIKGKPENQPSPVPKKPKSRCFKF